MTAKYKYQHQPNIFEQKCAYHPKQNITNFCKCQDCLLPVCPTCIKMHSEEHKSNKTSPKFEEINKVISEIKNTYQKLDELIQQIRYFLIQIQSEKKENEAKVRNQLLQGRNILIKSFQRCLIEMEDKIISQITKDGEEFISNMSQIDNQLNFIFKGIEQNKEDINEDILKHIIIFHGKKSDQKYKRELEQLKNRSLSLITRSIFATINDQQINSIKRSIAKYMRLQVVEDKVRSVKSVK